MANECFDLKSRVWEYVQEYTSLTDRINSLTYQIEEIIELMPLPTELNRMQQEIDTLHKAKAGISEKVLGILIEIEKKGCKI